MKTVTGFRLPATVSSLAVVVLLLFAGCSGETRALRSSQPELVNPPPPAGNPLAKVRLGMTYKQVREILASPNDENSYPTGKAFIPFYFGDDARRTTWYYKGLGRVVFAGGNIFGGEGNGDVIRVEYDPSESGVAPR